MASFDYRLNPLYAIKECSSCGTLCTRDCGCSKGGLEDKILVPIPDLSRRPLKIEKICLDCGDPVHGLYCRQCALIRKTLEEVFQDFQDTSKSSDDDTNFVNQEPFVVKQGPGVNSSQSPPQINHNCCYECGDSLDDIFCQRCTCKSCGKGAHYGYNCPPQIPIISNPEPCYNQNLNEILQNLQSLQQQCLFGTCQQCGCNEYDGVCFYCTVGNGTSINFSTPYSSNDSPSVANHPPQPQYVPYSCELCGNDSHYGYDCPPQVPFVYNQDPCFNQSFDYFPQTSPSFHQQYPCCENCGGPHETYQCQPMNEDYYHEQNSCYDYNSFGFDQFQPPQYTVNHPIFNAQNDFLNSQNKLMEQMTSICDMVGQYMQKKEEEKRIAEEQAAKDRYWKIPVCYDDDDDEESSIPLKDIISELPPCVAITPDSPKTNSLIMEDEHLDTILETESDELIKSSVEDLVQIPSESEDSSEGELYLHSVEFILKNHDLTFSNPLFDINEDFTSSDESFSEEDVPNENFKIFSNPLFDLDEEITSTKVDQIDDEVLENTNSIPPGIEYLCFNAKSDLYTSINDSQKIDSLLDEFAGELTLLKSIPPGIDDDNLDPEGEIHLVERLLYDNSSPRPPEEFNSENPTEQEIDIFLDGDKSIPPGIESDDFDSEDDDNSTSHPEFESFHVDYPDSGDSTIDVVEDIPVDVPNILPTHPALLMDFDFIPSNDLGSNLDDSSPSGDSNKIYDPGICIKVESTKILASKEKSPSSLSHRGFKASKLFHQKSPMLIHGDNTPNLGVRHPHFYPP
ncbi:hypothetical protein Tco_0819033 [Tanacetum coccineum]|uniref:CCHC-type domain-containing protein n=1 Tax=Tanacetum coccineum TaxID=301880 RepID=A0ABQ5AA04_9ASTR